VCQSFLGAKIHDAKDPGTDLANMFVQVVGSVFDLMETYERQWMAVSGAEQVPLFGFPHGVGLEPVAVNVERMKGILRQGVSDLREIWASVLAPDTLAAVMAVPDRDPFHLPDTLWVKAVYDFAVAYRRRVLPPDQILRSLVPLYLGRTASFVLETANSDRDQVEAIISGLAEEYVRQKSYLKQRWAQPTRREA